MITAGSNHLSDKKEVIIQGIPINYYECGSGTPVILLHGWPQTSYIWRKLLPQLQQQYHIFAVELPGMGNENPAQSADTQNVARLIRSFCDHLGLESLHMVAHDIGAWVAVAFALENENLLRSLSVLDAGIPALIPEEIFSPANAKKIWQFYFHAVDEIPEFLIAGKEKEYLTWFFSRKASVKDAITEADIDVYVNAYTGKEKLKNGFDYYRAYEESVRQNNNFAHKLALPILAVGGDNAQGLNMGIAMQKVSLNHIQAASIPNCGHYIAEEQPELLLELLLPFLKKS